MATPSNSSQQSRYPMGDRKPARRREVYRPEQNVSEVRHSVREERRESSPLSSARSDMDTAMRDKRDIADLQGRLAVERTSAARDDHSVDVSEMIVDKRCRDQERGRAFENMDPDDAGGRHDFAVESHLEHRACGPSQHQSCRPRSASPERTEETSYRSRSPLRAAPDPIPRRSHEIEYEKARIDQEAADFEAEYQQLLLEESIQKRNYFKAKVEEQRRKMAVYIDETHTSSMTASSTPIREPSAAIDDDAMHPGRPGGLEWFKLPVGCRSLSRAQAASLIEHDGPTPPSPELTIPGTTITTPSPELPLPSADGLNGFQRRILAAVSKSYAPRINAAPKPPRALGFTEARILGNHRLFAENYGGSSRADLTLCKFVFNTPHECPYGKDCACRHEPLDEEELEWIRTNPVPRRKNIEWHPGKWLEKLLQNYSSPKMPKVSRFDRVQRARVRGE